VKPEAGKGKQVLYLSVPVSNLLILSGFVKACMVDKSIFLNSKNAEK